jgi:hypothetical protein
VNGTDVRSSDRYAIARANIGNRRATLRWTFESGMRAESRGSATRFHRDTKPRRKTLAARPRVGCPCWDSSRSVIRDRRCENTGRKSRQSDPVSRRGAGHQGASGKRWRWADQPLVAPRGHCARQLPMGSAKFPYHLAGPLRRVRVADHLRHGAADRLLRQAAARRSVRSSDNCGSGSRTVA